MTEEERKHADNVAAQVALMAVVRAVIGEVFFDRNRLVFRNRLALLESATIDAISAQPMWTGLESNAAAYTQEAACGWVSRVFASIAHPDDSTSDV